MDSEGSDLIRIDSLVTGGFGADNVCVFDAEGVSSPSHR